MKNKKTKTIIYFSMLFIFVFVFLPKISYSNYINEINFLDNEFIEIYTENEINFENYVLIDESKDHNHSFNLIQNKSNTSNITLLVSNNFLKNYEDIGKNISNLKCSIYSSNQNLLGRYGLKSNGESFEIINKNLSNKNFNLNFTKNKEYNLNENTSINLNYLNYSYFIYNKSLCDFSPNQNFEDRMCREINFKINPKKDIEEIFLNEIKFDFLLNLDHNDFEIEYWIENYKNQIVKNKLNTTNILEKTFSKIENFSAYYIKANLFDKKTNCKIFDKKLVVAQKQNEEVKIDKCNYENKILLKDDKNIFENKIEFKIYTNSKNFTSTYWIEDYESQIVKNKLNTTNTNYKVFTPNNFSNIFLIKANIFTNDSCNFNLSKEVFFYSNNNESNIVLKSKEIIKPYYNEKLSYIKILNKNDILNNSSNKLKVEIYRGNTNKYTINFYNNKKIFYKTKLKDKFTKQEFEILLENLNYNFNEIQIIGLDKKDEIILNKDTLKTSNSFNSNSEKSKDIFNIKNIKINNSNFSFNIEKNFKTNNLNCYLIKNRKKLSNIKNITNLKNISLVLNLKKFKSNFNLSENNNLEIICKYIKENYKSTKYFKKQINFSNKIFQNISLNFENNLVGNFLKKQNQFDKNNTKINENYESKNQKVKNLSLYIVFLALILFFSIMLIKF